jgi:ribose transport system ATP-binding protein
VRAPLRRLLASQQAGLVLVILLPEDRKRQGLVLPMSAQDNATLPVLPRLAALRVFRRIAAERSLAREYFDRLRVRASSPEAEIHALVDELAAKGHAVVLISSELPEVLNLSTRLLVLRDGRVAGELPRGAGQDAGIRLMAGVAA